jgi:hypothetical protein
MGLGILHDLQAGRKTGDTDFIIRRRDLYDSGKTSHQAPFTYGSAINASDRRGKYNYDPDSSHLRMMLHSGSNHQMKEFLS